MPGVRLALLAATCAACAAQPQPAPLAVEAVKPGVYWAQGGSGANVGILVGAKEAVVIDAKMTAESAQAVLAEVRKLTPNPVRYLVLTHSDGDHVNGLTGFPQGLRIVAHPNCRADLQAAPNAAALEPWLPNEMAEGKSTLKLEGLKVELLHFGPAHTSGDLVVWLPARKVAFVGDLVFLGREPLIHLHKRGTSLGVAHTLKKLLELDADAYISGHAGPAGKEEVRGLLVSLEEKQAKVGAMIRQGKTLDEVKREFGVAAGAGQRRPGLIEVIYGDLSGKR